MTEQDMPTDGQAALRYPSPHSFLQTLERIENAIAAGGMTIFARIDHAAGAHAIGLTMPPTVVLLYGNPRGGTPVMLATPDAALDLPLRVLVREDADGRGVVAFHPIVEVLRDAGVSEDLALRLQPAQTLLVNAVSS